MNELVVINNESGVVEMAAGGGMEGAERTMRETAAWTPHLGSPDQIISRGKVLGDSRARDMSNNDGYARGAVGIHKDSIVGGHYRLNASPAMKVLQLFNKAFDETWLKEFREIVEARFDLIAEGDDCWLDNAGLNTLTGLVRLSVGSYMLTGEMLATAEWRNRDPRRPLSTAIQMVSPARLCNPDGASDDRFLRRGVRVDAAGKPVGYWFRMSHPGENYPDVLWDWKYVPARKPWGRRQVLHILEQQEADQHRGIGDIVSVLKNMRMTKQFDELTLQRAVVQASYASAIESELPPDVVYGMMGGGTGPENFTTALGAYLSMLNEYFGAANNVAIDGVKMPVLPPGTKLNVQNIGNPEGLGSDFGSSLMRHTAAGLGISGEEFANDFSKANYSGLRSAVNHTGRRMKAKKKIGADRFAGSIYSLVLEEEIANGNVPLPSGVNRDDYYLPLFKEAISKSSWIGAGAGQIDELKETQAAMLRIKAGLATYEEECSKLGKDYREVFAQRAREEGILVDLNLDFSLEAQRAGQKEPQNTLSSDPKKTRQDKKAPAK